MPTDERYEGWRNAATWMTYLYLSQDYSHCVNINRLCNGHYTPDKFRSYCSVHIRLDDTEWVQGQEVDYDEIAFNWRNENGVNQLGFDENHQFCLFEPDDSESKSISQSLEEGMNQITNKLLEVNNVLAGIEKKLGGNTPETARVDKPAVIKLVRCSDEIAQIIATCRIENECVYLPGQLERSTYSAVNKLLNDLGGRWNRHAGAHVFNDDPTERINLFLMTGTIELPPDLQFYPTMGSLADRVVELGRIESGMLVLDPEIGEAHLADKVAQHVPGAIIHGFELDEERAKVAGKKYSVTQGDFLTQTPQPIYDRIIMNPPFSKFQDCKHVLHAFKFLKPGSGRLVSVMSGAILYTDRGLYKDVKALINRYGGIIEQNPDGSFKVSGTMVRTATIVIDNQPLQDHIAA